MNKIVTSYFDFILGVLAMTVALAYTFWSMTEWTDTYDLLPSNATVFVENTKIPETVHWTGDQVVAKLYRLSEEEIQVEVDGRLFKTEADVKKYQSTIQLNAQFKKTFIIAPTGKITKIIFSTIEKES